MLTVIIILYIILLFDYKITYSNENYIYKITYNGLLWSNTFYPTIKYKKIINFKTKTK